MKRFSWFLSTTLFSAIQKLQILNVFSAWSRFFNIINAYSCSKHLRSEHVIGTWHLKNQYFRAEFNMIICLFSPATTSWCCHCQQRTTPPNKQTTSSVNCHCTRLSLHGKLQHIGIFWEPPRPVAVNRTQPPPEILTDNFICQTALFTDCLWQCFWGIYSKYTASLRKSNAVSSSIWPLSVHEFLKHFYYNIWRIYSEIAT